MCLGEDGVWVMFLHSVHSGMPLGQRTQKGNSELQSLQPQELSYLWLSGVECCVVGQAKQSGSEWLKIYLFGVCLKQMDVKEFEFGIGELGLMVLTCCEEINIKRTNTQEPSLTHLYARNKIKTTRDLMEKYITHQWCNKRLTLDFFSMKIV